MRLNLNIKKDESEEMDNLDEQEVVRPTKPPRPKEEELESES